MDLFLRRLHELAIYFCQERLADRGFRNASRVASSDTALIINPQRRGGLGIHSTHPVARFVVRVDWQFAELLFSLIV